MTGPVVAEAMFVNREEIPVCPLYRDPVSVYSFHLIPFFVCFIFPSQCKCHNVNRNFPSLLSKQVHDFGFFRYDPGAIKFLKYDEIPLAPEAASVGLEIRVVGNDSGEKVL
jgi:hypothetical protein